jgi:hypothetical protein
MDSAAIDIFYNNEEITLVLDQVQDNLSVWRVFSTDWGDEKYYPQTIALTFNQPLKVNNWLKIYGARSAMSGEAAIHLGAPKDAIINRRDRADRTNRK